MCDGYFKYYKTKTSISNPLINSTLQSIQELKTFINEQIKVQLCTPKDIFGHKKTCSEMLQVK